MLYGQTIFFDFSYFDDNALILEHQSFLSEISNIPQAFQRDVFMVPQSEAFYYRPFLTIYFMISALLGGQNAGVYHFFNIVLHLISAFLVYLLFQKLKMDKRLAFLASLLFAVHPVSAQAVAWIPGGNDPLAAIFIISAFIFFIDYFRSGKWRDLIWHQIFWLGALFSKETAVFAPVLFALYIWGNKNDIFEADKDKGLTKSFSVLIGWILVFFVWFILRMGVLGSGGIHMSLWQAIESIYVNSPAIILYIGKIFFPFNLSVLPILEDSVFVYGYLAIAALLILFYLSRKNLQWDRIIFGLVWFLVFLIPSFIRPNQEMVADFLEHRVYISLIGFIFIFWGIDWDLVFKNFRIRKIVFVLALTLFSVITFSHNSVFMDKISFWENAVNNSPHAPLAHRNLGAMYWLDEKVEEAEREYRESLKLNLSEPMVHNNLGLIFARQKDYESAIKEYEAEIRINPYFVPSFYNMGLAYWNLGKKAEAADKWIQAINFDPDYIDAYKGLIVYYQEINRKDLMQRLMLELQRIGE